VEKSRISARIRSISESATLKVDARAKAMLAAGEPVISYAAGEPDFPTPDHVVEAAALAVRDPKNHRYTPAAGLPELRAAIAEKTLRDSGTKVAPEQVVVTNGGKQGVYQAFAVLLDPGDEVLVPTPYWTTYPEAIKLAGGVQVDVFAGADQGYRVTVDQLDRALTPRTKVLLMVSPSNPTGAVYSDAELLEIGTWALKNDLWVVSDEIYQNLTYDGIVAKSITELVPELAERTIMINGVAKSYAMTGWRLGWMVAPLDAAKAATNMQSHLTSNVSNISQRAALAALTGPQEPMLRMREAFDRRRQTAVRELNRIPGMVTPNPQGAFYVYPDVTALIADGIAGRKLGNSLEFCDLLLEEIKVAVVPGEAFGPSGYLRMSYALGDAQLEEGIARMQQFLGVS